MYYLGKKDFDWFPKEEKILIQENCFGCSYILLEIIYSCDYKRSCLPGTLFSLWGQGFFKVGLVEVPIKEESCGQDYYLKGGML